MVTQLPGRRERPAPVTMQHPQLFWEASQWPWRGDICQLRVARRGGVAQSARLCGAKIRPHCPRYVYCTGESLALEPLEPFPPPFGVLRAMNAHSPRTCFFVVSTREGIRVRARFWSAADLSIVISPYYIFQWGWFSLGIPDRRLLERSRTAVSEL